MNVNKCDASRGHCVSNKVLFIKRGVKCNLSKFLSSSFFFPLAAKPSPGWWAVTKSENN